MGGRATIPVVPSQPVTEYARVGDASVAYQVVGDGPIDLLLVPNWITHIEGLWEIPAMASYVNRLAQFGRVIMYDQRGTGMSDPVPLDALPTLEERMDDVRAIMEAIGSKRAVLTSAHLTAVYDARMGGKT